MESAPENKVSNLANHTLHNGATNSQETQSDVPKKTQKASKAMEKLDKIPDFLKQVHQILLDIQQKTQDEALKLQIVALDQLTNNVDQILSDLKHEAKIDELYVDIFQIWKNKAKKALKELPSCMDFLVVKKAMEEKRIQDKSYRALQKELQTLKDEHKQLQSRFKENIKELEREIEKQKKMNAKLICGDLAFSTKNMMENIFGFPISNQQDLLDRVSELEDLTKKERASRAGFDDSHKATDIMNALQKLRKERLCFAHPSFFNGPYDDKYFAECLILLNDPQIEKFVKDLRDVWKNLDFKSWEPYKDYTYFDHPNWKPEHKNR